MAVVFGVVVVVALDVDVLFTFTMGLDSGLSSATVVISSVVVGVAEIFLGLIPRIRVWRLIGIRWVNILILLLLAVINLLILLLLLLTMIDVLVLVLGLAALGWLLYIIQVWVPEVLLFLRLNTTLHLGTKSSRKEDFRDKIHFKDQI